MPGGVPVGCDACGEDEEDDLIFLGGRWPLPLHTGHVLRDGGGGGVCGGGVGLCPTFPTHSDELVSLLETLLHVAVRSPVAPIGRLRFPPPPPLLVVPPLLLPSFRARHVPHPLHFQQIGPMLLHALLPVALLKVLPAVPGAFHPGASEEKEAGPLGTKRSMVVMMAASWRCGRKSQLRSSPLSLSCFDALAFLIILLGPGSATGQPQTTAAGARVP